MPSKPAKYGIKIWAACDANSSYALDMQVYTGKLIEGDPEKNQGMSVVLKWQSDKGDTTLRVTIFTSYNLGQELPKRKLTMVGTVRKNRTELPAELLEIKNRAPPVVQVCLHRHHSPCNLLAQKGKERCAHEHSP